MSADKYQRTSLCICNCRSPLLTIQSGSASVNFRADDHDQRKRDVSKRCDEINLLCNALRQLREFLPLSRLEAEQLVSLKAPSCVAAGFLGTVVSLVVYDAHAQRFMGLFIRLPRFVVDRYSLFVCVQTVS